MGDAIVPDLCKDSYDVEVVVVGSDHAGTAPRTNVAYTTMPGS